MPLRVRLTLWYGTALALILMTFSVVLYTITARGLRDQVDESLQETASAAVRSLEKRGFLPLIDEDALLSQFPELTRIDKFFQIFSPTGTITIRSPNIRQHDVPLSRSALEAAFTGSTVFESARYPNEPRSGWFPFRSFIAGLCSTSCRSARPWKESRKPSAGSSWSCWSWPRSRWSCRWWEAGFSPDAPYGRSIPLPWRRNGLPRGPDTTTHFRTILRRNRATDRHLQQYDCATGNLLRADPAIQ